MKRIESTRIDTTLQQTQDVQTDNTQRIMCLPIPTLRINGIHYAFSIWNDTKVWGWNRLCFVQEGGPFTVERIDKDL